MKVFYNIALSIWAYVLTGTILFGDPLQPIMLLTRWNDRLSAPNWQAFLFIGISLGTLAGMSVARSVLGSTFAIPVFVVVSITFGTMSVGIYVEYMRSRIIDSFDADKEIRKSFFRSIRNAPQDYQLFLHGAALKECIPYAWSYRTMSFYRLPENAAVNVLPPSWIKLCKIERR